MGWSLLQKLDKADGSCRFQIHFNKPLLHHDIVSTLSFYIVIIERFKVLEAFQVQSWESFWENLGQGDAFDHFR